MGIIDDKKSIITEIGALNSIKDGGVDIPSTTNTLSSINNSEDSVSFLIDILTVLVGSEALKRLTGELITNFSTSVTPDLKNELKDRLNDFDSNVNLPTEFVNNGYRMPAKDIDIFNKLKTDPNSDVGELIYSNDTDPDNFDKKAYDAIVSPNTEVPFNNITILYDDIDDVFVFKPIFGTTIGSFINTFVNGMVLYSQKTFITEVFDILFGSKTAAQNKTKDQVFKENKVNKTIENFIRGEALEISDDQLRQLQDEAEKKVNGTREVDVGCGVLTSTLTTEEFTELNNKIISSSNPDVAGE